MHRRHDFFADFPPLPRLLPDWSHASYLVLIAALVIRTATGMALQGQLRAQPDVDGYARLAKNLAVHNVLGNVKSVTDGDKTRTVRQASAYRPPLYPLVLRWTAVRRGELSFSRVILLHVLLGAATAVLVWHLALRCGLGSWGLVAAAAVILDPLLINQASLVMTETLATFLVAASLWFLARRTDYLSLNDPADRGGEAAGAEVGEAGEVGSEVGSEEARDEGSDKGSDEPEGESEVAATSRPRPHRSVDRMLGGASSSATAGVEDDWLPLLRYDIAAGFALGLAALCRPTFLAWIGLLVIFEFAHHLYHQSFERLARLGVLCLTIAVVLAPWTIRNARLIGKATPTTTHGGYTLLLGNNPDFYRHLREQPARVVWSSHQLDEDRARFVKKNRLSEVEADRDAYDRAFRAIETDRKMFLYSCGVRLARFWTPMPHKTVAYRAAGNAEQDQALTESFSERMIRLGSGSWYNISFVLLLLGVTVAVGRKLSGPWLEGSLLVGALTFVHLFYWSNMRMRAPLTPFLALLVAAGASLVCSRDRDLAAVKPLVRGRTDNFWRRRQRRRQRREHQEEPQSQAD